MASSNNVDQSILELAQKGNFRAIAYWLNVYLIPQKIYVHVQQYQPGCLGILIEFQTEPDRERLLRFICHRLWQLNSEFLERAHLTARYVGQSLTLWHQFVRISPASQGGSGKSRQTQPLSPPEKNNGGLPSFPLRMPPSLRHYSSKSSKRQSSRGSAISGHLGQSPSFSLKAVDQVKVFRAFVLSGSAVAAFILGIWAGLFSEYSEPALPVLGEAKDTNFVSKPSVDEQWEAITLLLINPLSLGQQRLKLPWSQWPSYPMAKFPIPTIRQSN